MTLSLYRIWTSLVHPTSFSLTKTGLLFFACCIIQAAQAQWTNGTDINNTNTGNVGIGTASSGARLEVKGNNLGSSAGSTTQLLRLAASPLANYSSLNVSLYRNAFGTSWLTTTTRLQAMTDNVPQAYIDFNPPGELYGMALGTAGNEMMRFLQNGTIGIGTTNPGTNKLAVEGTIAARKVVVTIANPFPDYVFKKDYRLPSLSNVAHYIRSNGHLPDMPTADSVQKNGLDLGGNQALLVKKIEELTLYLVEQNRQLKSMQAKIERLEKYHSKK